MSRQIGLAGLANVLAQFLKNQGQTDGGRRIPMIDKLTKQEEFPVWRDKLIRPAQARPRQRVVAIHLVPQGIVFFLVLGISRRPIGSRDNIGALAAKNLCAAHPTLVVFPSSVA